MNLVFFAPSSPPAREADSVGLFEILQMFRWGIFGLLLGLSLLGLVTIAFISRHDSGKNASIPERAAGVS